MADVISVITAFFVILRFRVIIIIILRQHNRICVSFLPLFIIFSLKVNPSFKEKIGGAAGQKKLSDFLIANKSAASGKVRYFNARETLDIDSIIFTFQYGPLNAVKNAAVGVDTKALAALMSSGANNATILVDQDSAVLINPDYESEQKTYVAAQSLIDSIKDKEGVDNTQSLAETEDGRKFISIHKTKDNLYVITSVSENSVFAVINRTTYRIILFSLAILFIAIMAIRLFSKNITNPIADLVDASAKIERGEFELDIKPRTHDEIGLLTSSFIQMGKVFLLLITMFFCIHWIFFQ